MLKSKPSINVFSGWNKCQSTMVEGVIFSQNVYNAAAWNIVPHAVITDQVPTTFTRAPGSLQVNTHNKAKTFYSQTNRCPNTSLY